LVSNCAVNSPQAEHTQPATARAGGTCRVRHSPHRKALEKACPGDGCNGRVVHPALGTIDTPDRHRIQSFSIQHQGGRQ
jgi:hypothetical protein